MDRNNDGYLCYFFGARATAPKLYLINSPIDPRRRSYNLAPSSISQPFRPT